MKRIIFGVLLVCLSLVLVSCGSSDFPPEPPAPGEVGDDGGAVAGQAYTAELGAAGYADPTGSFSIDKDIINLVGADASSPLNLKVATEALVYKTGYRTNLAGNWVKYTFPGTGVSGSNWLDTSTASAATTLTIDNTNAIEGENYVVAYACTRVSGAWNCHDSKWMIHAFTVSTSSCVIDTDCAGGEICESAACQTGCRNDDDCIENSAGPYCDNFVCSRTLPTGPTGPGGTTTATTGTPATGTITPTTENLTKIVQSFDLEAEVPLTVDTDLDGIANDVDNDDDNDGVLDISDNCRLDSNVKQLDLDEDGKGNVCDADADADGYEKPSFGGADCKDLNAAINPGAVEACSDALDNNCDGKIDTADDSCGGPPLCMNIQILPFRDLTNQLFNYLDTLTRKDICESATGCTFSGLEGNPTEPDYTVVYNPDNDYCEGTITTCPDVTLYAWNTQTANIARREVCESAGCTYSDGGDNSIWSDVCE